MGAGQPIRGHNALYMGAQTRCAVEYCLLGEGEKINISFIFIEITGLIYIYILSTDSMSVRGAVNPAHFLTFMEVTLFVVRVCLYIRIATMFQCAFNVTNLVR